MALHAEAQHHAETGCAVYLLRNIISHGIVPIATTGTGIAIGRMLPAAKHVYPCIRNWGLSTLCTQCTHGGHRVCNCASGVVVSCDASIDIAIRIHMGTSSRARQGSSFEPFFFIFIFLFYLKKKKIKKKTTFIFSFFLFFLFILFF